MKKLRSLDVCCNPEGGFRDGPNFLSNELRYIYWNKYPASPFPENFYPSKLVALRLHHSLQEQLWKGDKYLPCLKELELSCMDRLLRTPDFDGIPCLQKLSLFKCSNLEEINPSLGYHTSLVYIYVGFCGKLRKFPTIIQMKKLEILYISCCRKLREFPNIKANMDSLLSLHLNVVGIQVLPSSVGEYCSNLISLKLNYCKYLKSIDFSLSQLTQLKLLDLSRCINLVELHELPSSLSILKADACKSLEVVGDFHRNCKWLCQVSLLSDTRVIGGDNLLQTMLQGKAIENQCAMSLQLKDYELAKGFRPRLRVGSRCRLQLPENWYNDFSGFLICAVLTRNFDFLKITMKHKKDGLMGMDSQHGVFDGNGFSTWVGYVPFGSLRCTTWWNEMYNTIYFSIDPNNSRFRVVDLLVNGFGVTLVPKKNQIETATTTNSFSESSNDYTCTFKIKHDSKSALECLFY